MRPLRGLAYIVVFGVGSMVGMGALSAVRAPKVANGLPKPVPVAAAQPDIGNIAECPVKIKAVVRGSDFIGRNIVAEFGIARRILRIPRQVPTGQLLLD